MYDLDEFEDGELVIFRPISDFYLRSKFANGICRVLHKSVDGGCVILYKGDRQEITEHAYRFDYGRYWYLEKICQ